jgi:arginase
MELALATGRGPSIVTDLDGQGTLIADDAVVVLGRRDADEAEETGSQRIEDTAIPVIDLSFIRREGIDEAIDRALQALDEADVDRY